MTDAVTPERLAILPQWAQRHIAALNAENERQASHIRRMETAHAVLTTRDWHTIPGPPDQDERRRRLWWLDHDQPFPLCSLGPGDVLLVGRAIRPPASSSPADSGDAS